MESSKFSISGSKAEIRSAVSSVSDSKFRIELVMSSISFGNRKSSKFTSIDWSRSSVKLKFLVASRGSYSNTLCDAIFKLY